MSWAETCRSGSSWVTSVELEFHHVLVDPDAPDDPSQAGPFPADVTTFQVNSPNGFLVWLADGSSVHASWAPDLQSFRIKFSDQAIARSQVRAWAVLPFPLAPA